MSFERKLWPSQVKGVNGVFQAEREGHRRILVASPTGMGKSGIAAWLIRDFLQYGKKVALYTHRKMLMEQLSKVMRNDFGLDHGILAAGYKDEREKPFQIVSAQTADARTHRRDEHRAEQLFDADLVLVEECHLQSGESMERIANKHLLKPKAIKVGITATPIDLGHAYDHLVQAGVNSDGRAQGSLVAAHHFGPDEPDLKGIKQELGQDLTEGENRKAIMRKGIFGRVLENYRTLNPEQRPTILFAPGVAESVWFAEEFEKAGISAAHIDGDNVWIRGEMHTSSRALRQEVLDGTRDGSIKVVCNRFVLREGIDAPWLSHGIFATVFGSLQSYLQSGGRLLRASPSTGKKFCTIQDHGSAWWRHGSLNEDRHWSLDDTAARLAGMREEALRTKKVAEPCRCRVCSKIGPPGKWCSHCGADMRGQPKTRMVVQSDGTLKPMVGDIFRERRVYERPEAEKVWSKAYFRARNAGFTFNQARGLYQHENFGLVPPPGTPLMPKNEVDWYRRVSDVPRADLY